MRRARILKSSLRAAVLLALGAAGLIGWRWGIGNFGTVVPGRIYRSAQLSASGLTRTLQAHQVRTVLNLRGANPDQAWYRAERAATLRAGATQVDLAMASDQWLSRAQLRTLIQALDRCDPPLLIHCEFGAERTGLASAFAELLRPGSTLAAARAHFSPWFLFLPIRDGRVMASHLDQYESWLRSQGRTHSPEQFRRWIADGYRPNSPSREYWPYNPYPLLIVTRPEPESAKVLK